ncbi:MAG TPA: thiol-disulfide oxidoreductase DCC family protein [Ferruginibacter sp.]|jgi:predicted DCC family thiol-disulfide oxidoreductase YuxK|nr:thiol-disulfide oxidoreductase DCC family protein [Ferruginibacter sp.]
MKLKMDSHPVILFDGVCNFCNSAVNFTLKRNKKANILFAPLQSEAGQGLLKQYGLPLAEMRSFIFMEDGKAYNRSTAALRVCRHLRGGWPLCYGLIIVPKFIRDGIYNWIAKNRYKWFGVRQECMIPTPGIKARFLT